MAHTAVTSSCQDLGSHAEVVSCAVAALLYMVTEELLVSAHEDGIGHRWWVDIQVPFVARPARPPPPLPPSPLHFAVARVLRGAKGGLLA